MTVLRDLRGLSFGRLTVVERGPDKRGHRTWWCVCSCGERLLVDGGNLVSGHTRSCGCLRVEVTRERLQTHGLRHTPEYRIWHHMIQRCHNPRDAAYHNYGGRGIIVCDRWRDSFLLFVHDMGLRPTPQHTIERTNNALSYTPENTVWATRLAQARNKRTTRLLTLNGTTQPLTVWAEQLHLKPQRIHSRLHRGWSVERALTTPMPI